jgi:catecholate siderophore receptor
MNSVSEDFEGYSVRRVSAVAGLMAVATFSGAQAQQPNLPPVC